MTLRYLLDTNILSEPLRKVPNPAVLTQIQKHQQEIATAAQVLYKIIRGAHHLPDAPKRTAILSYVENFIRAKLPVLPYDEIAAIAKTHDLILVTRNMTDFKNFSGLEVENWFLSQ
ncbi:PIN domain-containing protein [Candidatus Venteria ishoeyi]|uniref:tRNA(fMet)-specific endonuclease VapC n=1 Tax=Candidatus Venteria ishoeyi TaxID=1899563 RepID=A0A1H6FFC7_9GAMM|nr:type II toxin-antitoxin system VapC family toxin [Candidatus Venteria ishoeyi]SEH08121.1 tRNA(fMet)-specific endonuclease VapC [Candidatus Venteria ishoeyi]